jgi:hypothetical protein
VRSAISGYYIVQSGFNTRPIRILSAAKPEDSESSTAIVVLPRRSTLSNVGVDFVFGHSRFCAIGAKEYANNALPERA